MLKLGVNVDHVATLRQARGGKNPDPVEAAIICQKAGAHSIVMHLREDRRHIQDSDLFRAKKTLNIRLNMEMSVADEIVDVALKLKPNQSTLVPEKRQERTTESGLDLIRNQKRVQRAVDKLKAKGIEVSLFIDPETKQIEMAKKVGAAAVEFHTGTYALATGLEASCELVRLSNGVKLAREMGLITHAGHGLDYVNVKPIRKIEGLTELNIGYSIITRSVWVGLGKAVKEMNRLIS